jgi:spore coat protein SA
VGKLTRNSWQRRFVSRTFHVLTQVEPFSEYHGGAISRVVANLIKEEEGALVVAPSADDSWGYAPEQVRVMPAFGRYGDWTKFHRNRLPISLKILIFRLSLQEAFADLQAGDVVWIHNRAEAAAALESLVFSRGAKLVLHMHNSHLLIPHLAKTIRPVKLHRFIGVSEFIRHQAEPVLRPGTRCSVLYNGANDSLFYPDPGSHHRAAEEPVILFASRLVPDKGAHVLLEAMRLLHAKGVRGRAKIIGGAAFGDSKPTRYMESLWRSAPPNIEFHKYCSGMELAARFREADIFCLPSSFDDPFPLAPLEAMASRLPVVATRSGGIPEAFADGGAILVPKDDPAELALALEKLLTDSALRSQVAEAGFASYKRSFTWPAIRHRYHELVDEIRSS